MLNQIINVPKLRFGEFEGEWVEKRLDSICKIERGRFSPRPRNNPIYYNGNIPFVQTSDIVKAKGRILNYSQTLNEKGLKVSKKFNKGTILITIAANIGYAGVLEIDMACPDSLIGLTVKDKNINYFVNYLLEIEQPRMDYLAIDNAQKNINIGFLKPYKFVLPQKQEQKKIATFLTSIDKKIEQLNQKRTLLESYKKGVMQKIFSQEIRFKCDDGGVFEDWKKYPIGNFIDLLSGFPFKSENIVDSKDGIPLLRGINITEGKIRHSKEIDKFYIGNNKKLDKYFLKEGDLVISMDGSKVGKNSALIKKEDEGLLLIQRVARIRVKENTSLNFIYQHINSVLFHNYVNKVKTSSGIPHISSKQIKDFKINFPCFTEQQKISNFLTSIDQKITQSNQVLEEMKAFKKGLLQQMFV